MYELEPPDWKEFEKIDSYFERACDDIKKMYKENKESVYFKRQLQVRFEKDYFHWITSNALARLCGTDVIKRKGLRRRDGTSRQFFINPSNRYYKRSMSEINKIIDEYSDTNITRSCGHRAEILFSNTLMQHGFQFKGQSVKEFNGKKWKKTGHNLDFIFERKGQYWGCEIKNTLGYIDKVELSTKLEMCKYFGMRPLFIMRSSPKTYNDIIIKEGGYALIFVAQIYDLSQRTLVQRIRRTLGFPVDCPKAIPEGMINRFERWLNHKGM